MCENTTDSTPHLAPSGASPHLAPKLFPGFVPDVKYPRVMIIGLHMW